MYIVFKGSRPAGNKKFSTYERARQHARKLARKNPDWPLFRLIEARGYNPALNEFGYSVRKVATCA